MRPRDSVSLNSNAYKKGMTSQKVEGPRFRHERFQAVEVNG